VHLDLKVVTSVLQKEFLERKKKKKEFVKIFFLE
jgi:sRNA-binding regulator protein Hfq